MIKDESTRWIKTAEAARLLGFPLYSLHNWIRHGLIDPPVKDGSGHYVWDADDLRRVQAFAELRRTPPDRAMCRLTRKGRDHRR